MNNCYAYGCRPARGIGIYSCTCEGKCPDCFPNKRLKALVAVDLHGTIADKNDQPEDGALDSLNELKADGHEIGVFSCGATDEVKAWLDEHGMPYDYVNEEIPTRDSVKPDADAIIDNSAFRYDGDWNRTLAEVYASGRLEKSMTVWIKGPWHSMDDHPQLEQYETMLFNMIRQRPRSIDELRHSLSDVKLVDYVMSEMLRLGTVKDIDDPKRPGGTLYAEKGFKSFRYVGKSRTGGQVWYRS